MVPRRLWRGQRGDRRRALRAWCSTRRFSRSAAAFSAGCRSTPASALSIAGIFVVAVAVLSAILTALYAFQQEGWRELLSLSSAENGSIAVCLLGAALMFRQDGLTDLAGLAWTVALIHLAAHALAKGALFLTADGVYRATGDYRLVQRGILARSPWVFGVGALFAAMSLAAMPPQAGFVSEWYVFQTFFQGFHLASLASRLTAALAGAGMALTAAVAFATYLKVFGIGLLGRGDGATPAGAVRQFARGRSSRGSGAGARGRNAAVARGAEPGGVHRVCRRSAGQDACRAAAGARHRRADPGAGNLRLYLAEPARRRDAAARADAVGAAPREPPVCRAPGRSGTAGRSSRRRAVITTALTFSNALRTFYSFIYRPTVATERELAHGPNGHPYFVRRLAFSHDVAPIFGPYLFAPLERLVVALAERLRLIQSGQLNFYLSLIGALLVAVLVIALV